MREKYHKILTKEEELDLFKRYHDGDMKAFDELVVANQLNVYTIARDFHSKNRQVELDDLIQEANLILIRCIELFKPSLGFRLFAYSKLAIYNRLYRFLSKDRVIILPEKKLKEFGGDRTLELDSDNNIVDFDRADLSDFKLKDDMEVLEYLISDLNEDESFIITHYYGIFNTPKMRMFDIADMLGINKTVCSTKHINILKELRKKTIFL